VGQRKKAVPRKAPKRAEIWYAAHAIMYFATGASQKTFVVWEDVYLVKARTRPAALKRAIALARAACTEDETLRVNGRRAKMVFAGIRKMLWCAAAPYDPGPSRSPQVTKLYDGVEATFSAFVVRGRERLRKLARGAAVSVRYDE
jgi:hypothetical protein